MFFFGFGLKYFPWRKMNADCTLWEKTNFLRTTTPADGRKCGKMITWSTGSWVVTTTWSTGSRIVFMCRGRANKQDMADSMRRVRSHSTQLWELWKSIMLLFILSLYNVNYFVLPPETLFCAGNFKQSMGAKNQVGIGLSYRPAMQAT